MTPVFSLSRRALGRRFFGAGLASLFGTPVWAQNEGLELLGQFLRQVRSGRAQFTQSVVSPPKVGQAARTRQSTGTLEFARPGRFRFVYRKPFEQSLVADGQNLWLHDVDLNQVTVRPQAQALSRTPLALITTATELSQLQADFVLQAEPPREGLQWVRATPRAADSPLRQVLVGLRASANGPELLALELHDSLGARTLLQLSQFEINVALRPQVFVFTPPAGADVIRP